ncbi:MAG: type II secretion system protein [Gemmatimonadetes bacterium]|nr:MAG: type II secretion system protein [Gemmatimonadota bacterium]
MRRRSCGQRRPGAGGRVGGLPARAGSEGRSRGTGLGRAAPAVRVAAHRRPAPRACGGRVGLGLPTRLAADAASRTAHARRGVFGPPAHDVLPGPEDRGLPPRVRTGAAASRGRGPSVRRHGVHPPHRRRLPAPRPRAPGDPLVLERGRRRGGLSGRCGGPARVEEAPVSARAGATDAGRRRGGFTLIETMTVLLVMSVVTRIAVPEVQEVRTRARAAAVAADFNVIHVAAENYHDDHNAWPPDTGPGVVPPELTTYLPDGFTFERAGYTLDWENWTLPDGLPKHPETHVMLGASVTIDDPLLQHAVTEMLRERARLTLGNRTTFIFVAF